MKIDRVSIDSLVSDPRNARVHSPRNLETIRKSVAQFGQRRPIVARRDSRVVIAGNGLLQAMQQLGNTHVDVMWVDDDDQQAAAYALADNRAGELAAWDYDMLRQLAEDAGSALVGWTPEELAALAPSDIKANLKAKEKMGGVSKDEDRAKPASLMLLPDAIQALQGAIERAINRGAMSTSEAVLAICKEFGNARRR